jgi:hypothetical protein
MAARRNIAGAFGCLVAAVVSGACTGDPSPALHELAAEAGVSPSTIVRVAPDRLMGIRIAPQDIAVIEFRPDGAGGYTSHLVVRSDLARPGRNSVLMSAGSAGSLLFGTAARDIDRVVVGRLVESAGGEVENGVWLLWLPSTEDPMVRGW